MLFAVQDGIFCLDGEAIEDWQWFLKKIDGLNEAIDYVDGKKNNAIVHQVDIPEHIDVRDIRKQCQLSRTSFARKFGFSSRTIQHWEQGNRQPRGPARILLLLLQRNPQAIATILANTST